MQARIYMMEGKEEKLIGLALLGLRREVAEKMPKAVPKMAANWMTRRRQKNPIIFWAAARQTQSRAKIVVLSAGMA